MNRLSVWSDARSDDETFIAHAIGHDDLFGHWLRRQLSDYHARTGRDATVARFTQHIRTLANAHPLVWQLARFAAQVGQQK